MRNKKQVFFGANGLATFFGREDIGSITTDRIRDYLRFQKEKSRYSKLAAGTQKALIALGLILKHAAAKGLISHLPLMPNIKEKDSPRSWFNMVNSFLRASEWASLQHKHIRVVGGGHPHLEIAVLQGKTGERTA